MSDRANWFAIDKTQRLVPLGTGELFDGTIEDDLAGTQRISLEKMPIPTETVRIKFKPPQVAIVAPAPKRRWAWTSVAVLTAIAGVLAISSLF